jgi:HSP20 family molecular chaperone IbpA
MSTQLVKTNRYRNLLDDMFEAGTGWFVGFDKTLDGLAEKWDSAMEHFHEFPASKVSRVDDTHYVIDVAVDDFEKSELKVKLRGDELLIDGEKTVISSTDGVDESITKSLHQRFLLSDRLKITDASLKEGSLKISLESKPPVEAAEKMLKIH